MVIVLLTLFLSMGLVLFLNLKQGSEMHPILTEEDRKTLLTLTSENRCETDDTTLVLTAGSALIQCNDRQIDLGKAVLERDGTICVPLSPLMESIGGTVLCHSEDKSYRVYLRRWMGETGSDTWTPLCLWEGSRQVGYGLVGEQIELHQVEEHIGPPFLEEETLYVPLSYLEPLFLWMHAQQSGQYILCFGGSEWGQSGVALGMELTDIPEEIRTSLRKVESNLRTDELGNQTEDGSCLMNRYRSAELLVETLRIDPEREPEDLRAGREIVCKVEILSDQVSGKRGIRLGDPVSKLWERYGTLPVQEEIPEQDQITYYLGDMNRFEITVQHGRVIGLVYQGYHSGIW